MIEQAVILAGGQGKRLRAYTGTTPKPIAQVGGRPFLFYLVRLLASYGVKRVVLLLGHEAQQVVDAQDRFGSPHVEVDCVVGQPGWETAERLGNASDYLESEFLLLYSDNYFQFDAQRLTHVFHESDSAITLNCVPRAHGNVRITEDLKAAYLPKASPEIGDFVELGYAAVNRDRLEPFLAQSPELTRVLEQLSQDRLLTAMSSDLPYWSISEPERLTVTEAFLAPKPTVILDRDGVINARPPVGQYVTTWDEFVWRRPTVGQLRTLAARGVDFVVASNQAGIGRGFLTRAEADAISMRMIQELDHSGITILDKAMCPHDFDDGCSCRKPNPGMLLTLAGAWQLPLAETYFVGDDIRDVQTAIRAGCNSAFVGSDSTSVERQIMGQRGLVLLTATECGSEEALWHELAGRVEPSPVGAGEPQWHHPMIAGRLS